MSEDAQTEAGTEIVQGDAVEVLETDEGTAAAKLMGTLRALSAPDEDAGEMQLMMATVAMGLERSLGEQLAASQATGELDEFIIGLTRWIATHRSDSVRRLVVVELPRRDLPAATRLHRLDEAELAAESALSPL